VPVSVPKLRIKASATRKARTQRPRLTASTPGSGDVDEMEEGSKATRGLRLVREGARRPLRGHERRDT
jgi:hypothetical protein